MPLRISRKWKNPNAWSAKTYEVRVLRGERRDRNFYQKRFAQNLMYLRKSSGYSVSEFAIFLGLRKSSIKAYEQMRAFPKIETLWVLCDTYNITLDELIGDDISEKKLKIESSRDTVSGEQTNYLANNLRHLRKLNKLTQKDLAVAVGAIQRTISTYETRGASPKIGILVSLADYFELSKHDLAFKNLSLLPEMVHVEGGEFMMGSNRDENEKPISKIWSTQFEIGKYPVTNKEFLDFLNDTTNEKSSIDLVGVESQFYRKEDKWDINSNYEDHPVVGINWYSASEYCKWLSKKTSFSFRLPLEAEWEFAMGGGVGERTIWAGTNEEDKRALYIWFEGNSNSETQRVGQKLPNSLGLFDGCGNVWEMCQDFWRKNYAEKTPFETSNKLHRAVRGGSWLSAIRYCTVTKRRNIHPGSSSKATGFRIVRDIEARRDMGKPFD